MARGKEQGSEEKIVVVRYEGDIQMPGVMSEEDLVVGRRFQAGHRCDVQRQGSTGEYEITEIRNEQKGIVAVVKSTSVTPRI